LSNQEPIIGKVKKLLALADGNQNEHERDVAMKFAMDLLAKHNLTMESLAGKAVHDGVEEFVTDFKLEPWIRTILEAASILYYTDFYISYSLQSTRFDYWTMQQVKTYRRFPIFVGKSENIAVTIEVATWLLNSVRLESNRIYKDAVSRRSFRVGAADRLVVRARKLIQDEQTTGAKDVSNALVVLRNRLQTANKAYLQSLKLHYRSERQSKVLGGAYDVGAEYGDTMSLAPGKTAPHKQLAIAQTRH
jgi:hypothetical protein